MRDMDFSVPLTYEQMYAELSAVMQEQRQPDQIEHFLRTLATRGETPDEIAAAVGVLRRHAVSLPIPSEYSLCDTCGTGGDGHGTMNISTVTALVSAACGVKVCKHGNRAASSKCGSADLLEALGIKIDASPAQVVQCIEQLGFGFCFAPAFHPAMKVVMPVRKKMGTRTIFNLIGPLANPAKLSYQLLGVAQERFVEPMARALVRIGIKHAMVVHGHDGMDEVTTTAKTRVLEVCGQKIIEQELDAECLGLPRVSIADLAGGDAKTNAEIAHKILAGEKSAYRDMVLLNVGCVLYVSDQVTSIQEGISRAVDVIDSGKAKELLASLVTLSHAHDT